MARAIRLTPVKHDRKSTLWCGPAVVSAITGEPTSVIHEHMTAQRSAFEQSRRIIATTEEDLRWVMARLGYTMREVELDDVELTFGDWIDGYRREPHAGYIVMVEDKTEKHWVTVVRRMFCDTRNEKPIPLSKAPYRERVVLEVYEVRRTV